MIETLFGRKVELTEDIPNGIIRMNRDTWERIKIVAFRNAVLVETEVSSTSVNFPTSFPEDPEIPYCNTCHGWHVGGCHK